jgi:hypothetical protein
LAALPFFILLRPGFYAFDVDILSYTMPLRAVMAQAVADGHFPLWDSYTQCGQSLSANPASTIFYPLQWLSLGDGGWTGFRWYCIAHYFLLGWFAYLFFACGLRIRPLPALLGTLMLACSGYWFSMFFAMRIVTFPWLLLMATCWMRSVREGKALLAIGAGAALSMAFVAGSIQHVLVALGSVMLGTVLYCLRRRQRPQRSYCGVRTVTLAGIVAFSICLVPMQQILRGHSASSRGAGLSYQTATGWSTSPRRAMELLLPYAWGVPHPNEPYRLAELRKAQGQISPMEWAPSIFMGTAFLFLLMLPVLRCRRWLGRACWGAIFAAVYLALGQYAPGHRALFEAVPMLGIFRYPEKWLVWANLALATLTAFKLEALGHSLRHRKLVVTRMVLPPALVAVAAWFLIAILQMDKMKAALVARNDTSLLLLAIAVVLVPIVTVLARQRRVAWPVGITLLLLVIIETQRVNHMRPAAVAMPDPLLRQQHVLPEVLAQLPDSDQYRIVRQKAEVDPGSAVALKTVAGTGQRKVRVMEAATPAVWRLRTSGGLHPNATSRSVALNNLLAQQQQFSKLSALTHTRFVSHRLRESEFNRETMRFGDRLPIIAIDEDYACLLLDDVATPPRIRVLTDWVPVATPTEAAREIQQIPAERFASTAVLECDLPPKSASSAQWEVLEERSGRIVAEITTDSTCMFYYGDSLEPGWRAWLDGSAVPIYPANIAFMAVAVPAGTHRVELRYCWW